jgi:hypothetical protein
LADVLLPRAPEWGVEPSPDCKVEFLGNGAVSFINSSSACFLG